MYHNLDIWKDSITLIKLVYKVIDELPKSEEYNLKAQLRRAVVSVALNIAEGKNRQSAKDFAHFLNIAIASLGETEACISICEELKLISRNEELHEYCKVLSYRIQALKNKILSKQKGEVDE